MTLYHEGSKGSLGGDNLLADGKHGILPHRLMPGDYIVSAKLTGGARRSDRVAERKFNVRPGELSRVELTFP